MTGGLVVLLALIWALVLLPGALRSRRSSPSVSVGTFERAMGVLAGRDTSTARSDSGEGRIVYVPQDAGRICGDVTRRRNAVIGRRRQVFVRLLASAVAMLFIAVVAGGFAWLLFLAAGGALGTYVGLLLRWKTQAERADEVIRMLPDAPEGLSAPERREQIAAGGEAAYTFKAPREQRRAVGAGTRAWEG